MISIGQIEKNPASFVDYYKLAVSNPKEFCRAINFDEQLASSAMVLIVLALIQSVFAGIFGSYGNLIARIGATFGFFVVGMGIGSVIIFVVAKISQAKMNLLRCYNLVAHSWILTFPLTLLSHWLAPIGFISTIINLTLMVFVMISIFKAIAVRVYIVTGVLFVLTFVPMACMKMSQKVLEKDPTMQQLLQGRSLEEFAADMQKQSEEIQKQVNTDMEGDLQEAMQDMQKGEMDVQKAMAQLAQMQEGMEKSEKALPKCYHDEVDGHDDKNPVFQMVGSQMSILGMIPADKRQESVHNLEKFIDEAIRDSDSGFRLSDSQIICLKEIKSNLKKIQ